jgi:hypothetical protein
MSSPSLQALQPPVLVPLLVRSLKESWVSLQVPPSREILLPPLVRRRRARELTMTAEMIVSPPGRTEGSCLDPPLMPRLEARRSAPESIRTGQPSTSL